MQIKTFRARSMREALAMVRSELGPEASVLHTREAPRGPIERWLRSSEVEVAATADKPPVELSDRGGGAVEAPPAPDPIPEDELDAVVTKMNWRGDPTPVAEDASRPPLLRELAVADVDPAYARRWIDAEADDLEAARLKTLAAFARALPTSGPISVTPGACRVVVLVGPTGVGKTTTLAKLAAGFRLKEGLRVGVATVDTYRVAAVEQLRTYAEIIDLPMEVVSSPLQMRGAMERLADLDLVLIDTVGRSPRDEASLEELREILAEAAPDETHLLLSATHAASVLDEAIERFRVVEPTALLVTKLDEATRPGRLLQAIDRSGLPVSYLTDGQRVPDDIRVAQGESLARRALGWEAA